MASDYTVGDLVAEFITQCGVTTAFGIASVHNIPMLDAIGRRNAIRFVMARGELGGAHMADGYARVSGGLGVIFSSTGPGAANAIGGLIEARFSGTPVLHITGQTSTKFVDRDVGTVHDAPDQLGMLRSVSKTAYRIRSAQQAIGVLTRAAVDALTPPTGPVSVEVPIDLQRTPVERPAIFDNFVLPLPPPRTPTDAELDELAARVIAARRPMLWLGSGARRASASGAQAARSRLHHDQQHQRQGHRLRGTPDEPRRPARQRHAEGPAVLSDRRSAARSRHTPARPGDRRLRREAAAQHHPDRRRSAGQRPHLRQHLVCVRRRAGDAGGAAAAHRRPHEARSRLSQGLRRTEADRAR